MSLRAQLASDIKDAMRARRSEQLATLRMLSAAVKQREVDERVELTDGDILAIVEKLIKQRREAATQYETGSRPELAAQELAEADILAAYLPPQLDEAQISALITAGIEACGAQGPQDMGRVMGQLKSQLQGQADMALVSRLVKAQLSA